MPWYYINDAGTQPEGPFQFSELATRFQQGAIDPDTFVWHGKRVKEWRKISDVNGLQEKLRRHKNKSEDARSSRGSMADLHYPMRRTQSSRSTRSTRSSRGRHSSHWRRLVQIANLLVKTQDELERQKKENEIILTENRDHKSKLADLESKLKKEILSKQNLRKQWKKAQSEYESEIKQYQSQLDIFFAAETELNDAWSPGYRPGEMNMNQFGYAESVFSDDKSIQINLSFVE